MEVVIRGCVESLLFFCLPKLHVDVFATMLEGDGVKKWPREIARLVKGKESVEEGSFTDFIVAKQNEAEVVTMVAQEATH